MKKYELKLSAKNENIEEFIEFIDDKLKKCKVDSKCRVRTKLSVEELITSLISHASSNDEIIEVKVSSFFGQVSIHITCKGEIFDIKEIEDRISMGDFEEEERAVVKRLIDKVFGDQISISNKYGKNICDIKVSVSSARALLITLTALFIGILLGIVLKLALPSDIGKGLSNYIFAPVSTMFVNAVKLVVGPLVFFSIAASIAEFKNIKALGKIALRITSTYLFTSVIAIGIGYFVFQLFPIGDASLQTVNVTNEVTSLIERSQAVNVSIKDTIINIIPTNIVDPFQNTDLLQILFMATIFGLAVSIISGKNDFAERFLITGNDIFAKITGMIIKFLPLAIICSMSKMIITLDFGKIAKAFTLIPVCYLGNAMMIMIYLIMIVVFARVSPIPFVRKFSGVALTGFGLSSSNGVMPYSLDCCGNKLGISEKLYSFSIPLGTTINMDGTCIALMIISMFLSKSYGVEITGGALLSLVLSVMIISVGLPGVPGGTLIAVALILPQLGLPMEALSIIMGLHTFIGMGNVFVNVTGDAVVTLIEAKRDRMIDMEVYNK